MANTSAIGAGLGVATGVLNTGMGIYDRIRGKKMMDGLDDPDYQISQAVLEMVANAKNMAGGLPGKQFLENDQDNIYANAINNIENVGGSSTDQLSAIVRATGKRAGAQNEIGAQDASYRAGAQGQIRNALGELAGEQRTEFDIDIMQPFQRKSSYAQNLIAGGNNNINVGTSQAIGSVMSHLGNKDLEKYYETSGSMIPNIYMENYMDQSPSVIDPGDEDESLYPGGIDPNKYRYARQASKFFDSL